MESRIRAKIINSWIGFEMPGEFKRSLLVGFFQKLKRFVLIS